MGDAPNELEVLEARREILQLEIALAQEDRDPLRETLIENQKETPNLNTVHHPLIAHALLIRLA